MANLSEFDPVVSILIGEMASLPEYAAGKDLMTDAFAHNWLMEHDPALYGGILRIVADIRYAIYQEVDAALYTSDGEAGRVYKSGVMDCLKIIETRGEGPL